MADRPLLLIHGWSDHADSFKALGRHLSAAMGREVSTLSLVDWVSLDDDVTYEDLADGMQAAWTAHGLPESGRGVDVVLHSTGALVVRQWLVRHCKSITDPPIHHMLMLAPANFGSPLAHHGRSVAGRARIGFQTITGKKDRQLRRAFESGDALLRGLELGSPSTWALAEQDRFGPHAKLYGKNRILTTVLVGNEGSVVIADFDGSDGVVRTSTANLNCSRAQVEFRANPPEADRKLTLKQQASAGRTAFRVLNGYNHGGITLNTKRLDKAEPKGRYADLALSEQGVLDVMVRALTVEDDAFDAWCTECDRATGLLTEATGKDSDDEVHAHCNLVVRVLNQYAQPVQDFVLEIYEDDEFDEKGNLRRSVGRGGSLTRIIQREVIDDVHSYRFDESYRCFHIDCAAFVAKVAPLLKSGLSISVTATPVLGGVEDESTNTVGYSSLNDDEIGRVFIPREELGKVFRPHQTLLLEILLERRQLGDVFRLRPMA